MAVNLPPTTSTPMQTEPAKTVGELFASRQLVRTYIAAVVGIFALVLKANVDDGLIDQITTIVVYSWPFVLAGIAKFEQAMLARKQAEVTRENVFAPSTVVQERKVAFEKGKQAAGRVNPEAWGVNQ